MARYHDAKCRLCRREGVKLFLKGERCYSSKCPIEKKGAVAPGQFGYKSGRRLSDYGIQLREKQKTKRLYGILERQFKNYCQKAAKSSKATGEVLLQLLESRLDNVVYQLNLVSSRSIARQLVTHGHVLVDGQKVNIPSYRVKPNQVISLTAKGLNFQMVKKALANKGKKVPDWLQRKGGAGRMVRLPERSEISREIDENLIVEFYSR